MSRTQFLARSPSRPAAIARRAGFTHKGSSHLAPAAPVPAVPVPASEPIPVLCLAATLVAGQGSRLASAALARVTACGSPVGTVVLALENTAAIDGEGRDALSGLAEELRKLGIRLHLAIASPQVRGRWLRESGKTRQGALPVHPSLRRGVLACYALLPGPGLVTGAIRRDLERPAEHLSC